MADRIGDLFLQQTRYESLIPSDQEKGRAQPDLQRVFATGDRVPLPSPADLNVPAKDVRDAIETRSSLRKYAEKPLSVHELSFLLWCTQGVKRVEPERWTLRNVPSAGARHPFETILLANRVDGLTPGLYQYLALEHELRVFDSTEGVARRLATACLGQKTLETCAVAFLWVADRYRMAWRYGERGIRYLFLDAGHVCQNLYLAAETIGGGTCAIAAFNDDQVNDLLGLDGVDAFTAYIATVGIRVAE
ncbi:SagB/ThcOx family dehydrogenase [Candidatus Bipolaricaulota bacterium]|nr:SagB/ThcOx family dehydrogenase [Candidatus Bipolaricaulota bacterium]